MHLHSHLPASTHTNHSILPDSLQIQITAPLRPTNTPPLSLIPRPISQTQRSTPCSPSVNDRISASLQLHSRLITFRFIRSRLQLSNTMGFNRSFLRVGCIGDGFKRRDGWTAGAERGWSGRYRGGGTVSAAVAVVWKAGDG